MKILLIMFCFVIYSNGAMCSKVGPCLLELDACDDDVVVVGHVETTSLIDQDDIEIPVSDERNPRSLNSQNWFDMFNCSPPRSDEDCVAGGISFGLGCPQDIFDHEYYNYSESNIGACKNASYLFPRDQKARGVVKKRKMRGKSVDNSALIAEMYLAASNISSYADGGKVYLFSEKYTSVLPELLKRVKDYRSPKALRDRLNKLVNTNPLDPLARAFSKLKKSAERYNKDIIMTAHNK